MYESKLMGGREVGVNNGMDVGWLGGTGRG